MSFFQYNRCDTTDDNKHLTIISGWGMFKNTTLILAEILCDPGIMKTYRKWFFSEERAFYCLNQSIASSRYKDFSWQKYLVYRCDLGITKTYRKCFFSEERTFYHNESEWLIPKRAAKFARQVRSENDTWSLTGWENGGMTDYPILKHRMPFCAK